MNEEEKELIHISTGTIITNFKIASTGCEMTHWTDAVFLCRYAPQTRLKIVGMESRKTAALNMINLFSGRSSPHPSTAADVKTMIHTLLSPSEPGKDLFHFMFSDDSKSCLDTPSSSSQARSDVDKSSQFSYVGSGFWNKAYSEIEKLTDADLKANKEHLGLMYLSAIGFICLTLFQMKGRDVKAMGQYMRTQMVKIFEKLYKPPEDFLTIPAFSDECLNKLSSFYDGKNLNIHIQDAFGLVLAGYLYFEFGQNGDQEKVAVLMDGCLSHLMYNGLHMVKLFDQVKEKTNMDHNLLMDKLCDARTARPLEKMIRIYENNSYELKFQNHIYLGSMNLKPQITWKWARLFDKDHFKLLASYRGDNLKLCARLAAILAMYPEHRGISNMKIFRSPQAEEMFREEVSYAKVFFEKYCSKN